MSEAEAEAADIARTVMADFLGLPIEECGADSRGALLIQEGLRRYRSASLGLIAIVDEDDIAERLCRAAAPFAERRGSSGVNAWCRAVGVNRAHANEFINRKRPPTSDLLAALGIQRVFLCSEPEASGERP